MATQRRQQGRGRGQSGQQRGHNGGQEHTSRRFPRERYEREPENFGQDEFINDEAGGYEGGHVGSRRSSQQRYSQEGESGQQQGRYGQRGRRAQGGYEGGDQGGQQFDEDDFELQQDRYSRERYEQGGQGEQGDEGFRQFRGGHELAGGYQGAYGGGYSGGQQGSYGTGQFRQAGGRMENEASDYGDYITRGMSQSRSGQSIQRGQGYGQGQSQRQGRGFRGRGPKGYQRSDERITEEVNQALMDDDDIDAENIEVSVKDGEVTLTGFVCDRDAKRCAEDCAEDVSGVKEVQNHLRVKREETAGSHRGGEEQRGSKSHGTGSTKR